MSIVSPFCGLRFNPEKVSSIEDVVTPPYDVIDERAQAAYLAKNPYNMIQLDLIKKSGPGDDSSRYTDALNLFEKWQEERILVRDQEPCFYIYHTTYMHPSGKKLTRKGFVSLVGLAEFSEGIVKPHEKTFPGVTSDRLRLMETCQAHFSQIFSLYSDTKGSVMAELESAHSSLPLCSPLCSVEDQDGCIHAIWPVTDPEVIAKVSSMFEDRSLYIADGHHRYTTSLQLRRLMLERHGELPADSPYNRTLMYLCPMEDPGLSVLPAHRLVRMPGNVSVDDLIEKLGAGFDVEEITGGTREMLTAEVLDRMDEHLKVSADNAATMFGLYHAREDRCLLLTLKEGVMAAETGDMSPALQALDVVVLSDLALKTYLDVSHEDCEEKDLVDYLSDPDEALDLAVKESSESIERTPVLFLMNPTTVAQVRRVADEGLVMPHKSTYFYPKILTGLLLNKM
ncbi:MAG: DUF1015 domain-containing protein [Desulfobulbaceae bacterium]|nr:DUF1015 domain-containing protein [Desulfobulbaceae bacterium]